MISWLTRWTAPVDPATYLEALNPRWTDRLVGTIERITPVSTTAVAVRIRPNRGWNGHRAGQFVTIGVDIDGVRHHRCYSLTSAPDRTDGCIEIGVQAVAGGLVSNHLAQGARPGDLIQLDAADGDFTLIDGDTTPLLFVAGGSGITPLLGMLRSLAAQPSRRDVVVLNHAPTVDRLMFAAQLAELANNAPWLRIDTQLTQADGERLDAASLDRRCPDWRERDTFVCGPEALLDFATDHWDAHGQMGRLHLERFTAKRTMASSPSAATDTSHLVRFGRSDIDVVTDGTETLLDLAERAGLTPPSGCRMGICHTCVTPLLDGCARDQRDGRAVEEGTHVQLCVSTPTTDLTLDL